MNITSTATVNFKRCKFTGHAAGVQSTQEVDSVVESLRKPGYCYYLPYAYRLPTSESCSDEGDEGVGDKLLHLLQQFDVENVLLAVSRDDSSAIIGGNYLGPRRYRIVLECAKSVLELCYFQAIQPPPDQVVEEQVHSRRCPHGSDDPSRPLLELRQAIVVSPERQRDASRQKDWGSLRGQVNHFRYDAGTTTATTDVSRCVPRRNERQHPHRIGVLQEPSLSSAQRAELRCMRTPHREVEIVFRCVCSLKDDGNPLWLWNRNAPQVHVTSTLDWIDVRAALTDHQLNARLKEVDPQLIDHRFLDGVAALLIASDLDQKAVGRLRAQSTIAARFFPWLWSCIAFHHRSLDPSIWRRSGLSRQVLEHTVDAEGSGSDVQLEGQPLRARHSPPHGGGGGGGDTNAVR